MPTSCINCGKPVIATRIKINTTLIMVTMAMRRTSILNNSVSIHISIRTGRRKRRTTVRRLTFTSIRTLTGARWPKSVN